VTGVCYVHWRTQRQLSRALDGVANRTVTRAARNNANTRKDTDRAQHDTGKHRNEYPQNVPTEDAIARRRKVAASILDKLTALPMYLILPHTHTHYGSSVDSASNRNVYQECLWKHRGGATRDTPHRHLSTDCVENLGVSTSNNSMGSHGLLRG
jgi:hypothetical protein